MAAVTIAVQVIEGPVNQGKDNQRSSVLTNYTTNVVVFSFVGTNVALQLISHTGITWSCTPKHCSS